MGLHEIWLDAQRQLPDDQLLLKTAEGQVPITRRQLMTLIAQAAPGQEITVGGMTLRIGPDGESIAILGTSSGDDWRMPDNDPALNKSASKKAQPTFGDALLAQYRQNEAKHRF